ncbi:MAG TPA: coproporphyrinogen-III oxidase family protein [Acidobacteriota bacterium]|nr:coproporphyrinogen-III oxidase family protein [Acidobacteriota bacterium]
MTDGLKVIKPEPATAALHEVDTEVGSVFVSNYPPYSFWNQEDLKKAQDALNSKPNPATPIGLYLHIPFCRKRCKFCYFRVYTDKNSEEIQQYLDVLAREIKLYSELPSVQGRKLKFVYFGGGTPSFIKSAHLRELAQRVQQSIPWKGAEEITLECEPGTLTQIKLEAMKQIGVTRLSLGIENFDDMILRENGRAHVSKEIYQVLPWIQKLEFDQLNIDLIAGMIGETWDTWRDTVQKTIDISPDSVTIYQMELPFNTVYSKDYMHGRLNVPIANWQLKREWHEYAFDQLASAGYEISSGYTMIKKGSNARFVYRDSVWHGCDMLGTGVASFGHMQGVHIQNVDSWDSYIEKLKSNQLPLSRAFSTNANERLTREMILQLKLGTIEVSYFQDKFGKNILEKFSDAFRKLENEGMLRVYDDRVELTHQGFLRVDHLLPEFYQNKYRNSRYT